MIMTLTLVAFLVAAAVSLAVTPAVRTLAVRVGAIDVPGGRKVHAAAVPRLGGVAVIAGGLASIAVTRAIGQSDGDLSVSIAVGGALVFAVGVWDDVRSVTPWMKLAAIGAAAVLVMTNGVLIQRFTLLGHTYQLGPLAWVVTFLWIVVVTNAFNLIDGLDGLATGLAVIAGGACSVILIARGDTLNALVLTALVGAALGFLPYNFNPATIFLGDSGSLVFGFVLAVTAITGWQKGATALAVGAPLLVLALPLVDVAGSIVRRVAGGRSMFAADQRHIHHWLLRRAGSHRTAVLVLYALSIGLATIALMTADYH